MRGVGHPCDTSRALYDLSKNPIRDSPENSHFSWGVFGIFPSIPKNKGSAKSCSWTTPPFELFFYLELESVTWYDPTYSDKLWKSAKIFGARPLTSARAAFLWLSFSKKCGFWKNVSFWKCCNMRAMVRARQIFYVRAPNMIIFIR